MRLALVHVSQETNDFNPLPTTLRDFAAFGIYEGDEIIRKLSAVGQVGGHLAAVAASASPSTIETVPIFRAFSSSGGRITREAFDTFTAKIRTGLEAAGRIDGLVLQLHGACSCEGLDDVDGALTALCRDILGSDVPILLGLDHHANVTRAMVDDSTIIVGHRTQPHEPFDTGEVGTALLIRLIEERLTPVTAWRKIPLLSHQEQFLTSKGPMKVWFDRARAMEADPRVLQASPFPMQPWLDVAEGGWACVVVTDGDEALAQRLADELADLAWSMRDDFQVKDSIPLDDAVRAAEAAERGVVVLSDTGDTVFGGAAGDSNLILDAMLRLGTKSRALVPLIAPQAVQLLEQAGEGATVTLPLGGEQSGWFEPIEVTGTVRRICDGRISLGNDRHGEFDMGRTVVFDTGPVTLLISELRGIAGNSPDVYRAFGIDTDEYKIAVLKTASNFQYFAPMMSELIRADTSGPGQSDVSSLPWKRLPRPIYPLEKIADRRQGPR